MPETVSLRIDPEFKDLIPPLQPEEIAGLEASLLAEGCRDALIAWDGVLIDGHNRYVICQKHGIDYAITEKELADRDAAILWIIDNQMGRRNLADIDRIALQRRRKAVVAAMAKANQRVHGNTAPGKAKTVSAKLRQVKTSRELAKAAGVGERTYDAGELILDAAEKGEVEPEVIEAIRKKEKSIHRVARDLKEKRQRDKRDQTRDTAAAAVAEVDARIIVGDFREHTDTVPDNSVSLIFTDPPYDRKATDMLDGLGAFAAAKLAPGGSLICYVGQTQIPGALDALRKHLRYWWTIACIHAGRSTVMREYGVNAGWKAVLWFVKDTRHNNSVMVRDVMSGGEEKQYHEWQQSQSEAEYWIANLTTENDIVCDPFMGGGTTAAAAEKLHRRWIGFEIDENTARRATNRVAS